MPLVNRPIQVDSFLFYYFDIIVRGYIPTSNKIVVIAAYPLLKGPQ